MKAYPYKCHGSFDDLKEAEKKQKKVKGSFIEMILTSDGKVKYCVMTSNRI